MCRNFAFDRLLEGFAGTHALCKLFEIQMASCSCGCKCDWNSHSLLQFINKLFLTQALNATQPPCCWVNNNSSIFNHLHPPTPKGKTSKDSGAKLAAYVPHREKLKFLSRVTRVLCALCRRAGSHWVLLMEFVAFVWFEGWWEEMDISCRFMGWWLFLSGRQHSGPPKNTWMIPEFKKVL